MPRTTTAREDAIATAADLFRRHGYAATGLETILAASGAPKGSFYHHFPGGKEELAVAALRYSGDRITDDVARGAAAAPSPGALITAIAGMQAKELRESDYACGCPVATVALELAHESESIGRTADAEFRTWAEPVATKLRSAGRPAAEAARLARWAVANLEGALILARAARDATIVTDAAAITAAVLDATPTRDNRIVGAA